MHPEPRIFVISGLPGVGKSTVSRLLAERLGAAAHVEADRLQELIVAGAAVPDVSGTTEEAARQLRLRLHNAALLARSFAAAGFSAIIDDIVAGPRFDEVAADLTGVSFSFVMLLADLEVMKARWRAMASPYADAWDWIDQDIRERTPRVGLWVETASRTPEEVAQVVFERREEAVVRGSS